MSMVLEDYVPDKQKFKELDTNGHIYTLKKEHPLD